MSGKTVLITVAARGQSRAHALRFAEESADNEAADAVFDQIIAGNLTAVWRTARATVPRRAGEVVDRSS